MIIALKIEKDFNFNVKIIIVLNGVQELKKIQKTIVFLEKMEIIKYISS